MMFVFAVVLSLVAGCGPRQETPLSDRSSADSAHANLTAAEVQVNTATEPVAANAASSRTSSREKNSRTGPPASGPSNMAANLDPGIRFVNVAPSSGVNWTARNGEEAELFTMLESFGSGCAIADFDGDDRLDLVLAGGGHFGEQNRILPYPIALYRQTDAWAFTPVTLSAGLTEIRHYNHGTWSNDFDDDGFEDLLLTGWGGLQLFHNQGDGTFIEVTRAAGLTDTLWSLAAGWGDFNRDRVPDLYVGHYLDWSFQNHPRCVHRVTGRRDVCDPTRFDGLPGAIYLGQGDGSFREAARELGIREPGKTLGVVIADWNADRQMDLYVANDTLPNQLYLSQPDGRYEESAISSGVALGETGAADGSMGVDLGDIDGDGRLDLWVANFENQSFALYRQLGHDLFNHSSRAWGVTAVGSESIGFGTVIFDADGDGRPEIFCANGHVSAPHAIPERRQYPLLFWNHQGQRLRNIAPQAGEYMRGRHLGRGVAGGDLDRDGKTDLVVTHTNEPVAVLRNETASGNWIALHLIGVEGPRAAIGAQVIVSAGGRKQVSVVKGGASYLSTSDRTLQFGLGNAPLVDTIEIQWPTGQFQMFRNIIPGQRLLLREGASAPIRQPFRSGR